MHWLVEKNIRRIRKLQKSQKRVFYRGVIRVALVWTVTVVFLGWMCWDCRVAGPDNTREVIVSGDTVSVKSWNRRTKSICFDAEDERYTLIWDGAYSDKNFKSLSRNALEMSEEEEIRLTILDGTNRVVAVRGKTKNYVHLETYNQVNWVSCILLVPFAIAGCALFTLLFGFDIVRYLKFS